MMLTRSIAAAVLSLVACISPCFAYFPTTPVNYTHKQGYAGVSVRYKEVPLGICETVEGVRSFSGYFDVGHHEHLFFWFFEARNGAPEEAPLSVWINGGPGSSEYGFRRKDAHRLPLSSKGSMIGLFQEHGPCGIRNNEVIYNEYSWNNVSNMLYMWVYPCNIW
jgi:carboxypeptidase C (cathepsin A)